MGNDSSRDNDKVCYGKDSFGLNEYCYNTGYDHATNSSPDPIGDAIDVAPCTTNQNANKCYGDGYVAGMGKK